MRALSFIGTGISSSELSCIAEYCCGCDAALLESGAAWLAELDKGFDSLRLRPGRELLGRRSACRADVLRPRDVK